MAGTALIVNPQGALGPPVTDFRTGLNGAGFEFEQGKGEYYSYPAAATITKGQALEFVAPTATLPLRVQPMLAATSALLYAGCAQDGALTGESVNVIRRGVAIVKFASADTPAFGTALLSPDTNTGDYEANAAAVGNQIVGVCLAVEIGTTDTCLAFLDPTLSVEEV